LWRRGQPGACLTEATSHTPSAIKPLRFGVAAAFLDSNEILGRDTQLRRTLASTHLIESRLPTVERVALNVPHQQSLLHQLSPGAISKRRNGSKHFC
jgi:hypothetical protein